MQALDQLNPLGGRNTAARLFLCRKSPEEAWTEGKELVATHHDQDEYQEKLQGQHAKKPRHVFWSQTLFERGQRNRSGEDEQPQACEAHGMKDAKDPCQKLQPLCIRPPTPKHRDQDCPQEYSPSQVDRNCQAMEKSR